MRSRAEVVECLGLKPCCEGLVSGASMMDGRMSRSSIFFRIWIMTEFFQIAEMLIPATERLKISVRKAKSCAPSDLDGRGGACSAWWAHQVPEKWEEEEPALLMGLCNNVYIGETKKQLKERTNQHMILMLLERKAIYLSYLSTAKNVILKLCSQFFFLSF